MSYVEIARNVFEIERAGIEFVQSNLDENFENAVSSILASQGRVVVTGMGKSGIVGKKIAATLASTGTRSFFMHPGEAYHGDLGMIDPSDVILAISNSGETEELVRLLSFFNDNKNIVIAMTGKKDSTLVKYSNYFLNISIEKEACPLALAPTTSTTVTLAMGDALAVALMHARDFKAENFARFHPGGSLGRKLLVRVKDVMKTENLPVLKPEDKFDHIVSVISGGRLGLGVILEGKKIYGLVTDGDIRRLLTSQGAAALEKQAKDFCSKNPKVISQTEKIARAEEIMHEKKITSLLAVDGDEFSGILHLHDI